MSNPIINADAFKTKQLPSTTTKPTAYQQNLSQPVQSKPEEPWSTRRVMGNIAKISVYDPQKAQKMFDDLMYLQTDASSKYYNPYAKASNRAVDNLAGYGIDTSRIDDKFFHDNDYLLGYLSYNGQTNTPTKPGKKASEAEKAAWEYYQIKIAEDATKKVETQWQALQDELSYWANRKDRNYSDDEIISRIDWKKYSALTDLETKQRDGKPAELNRGTTFSRDAMYGVLWAARNGGSSGSIYGDMARNYNGEGTPWQFDQATADKLNPKSENYNPYSVGSTIDDAALYFGVDKFDQGWLQQNDGMQYGQDETAKKMYQKVLAAEGVTQKAEQELAELNKWIDKKLANAKTPEAADKILNRIDWNKYPTLAKMDKTIGVGDMPGSGDLLQLTRAVDYKYSDLEKRVRDACYENSKIPMDVGYVEELDAITGVAPNNPTDISSAVIKEQNKTLEDAADLFDGAGTESEQSMASGLWSVAFGWVKNEVSKALNAIPGKFTELTQNTIRNSVGNLSSSMLTDADVVQNYNIATESIPALQKKKAELEEQMGGGAGYIDAGKFDDSLVDKYGNVSLEEQPGWDLLTDQEKIALSNILNTADNQSVAVDMVKSLYNKYMSDHTSESVNDDIANEYRDVTNQLADAEAYVAANQETYDNAVANAQSAQEQYDALISMFDSAGLDTTELKEAKTVSNFLLGFTKYNPTKWESENVYAEYSHMAMANDGSFDSMYQVAEQADQEIMQNIEVAEWVLDYAERNGVQMPDSVRNNVQRWLNSMQRQHQDFENLSVLKNEDREEMVAKGREMANNPSEFDWNAYDGTLESQPAWNLLSEQQKETLLSMTENYDINDIVNQMNGYLEGMDVENRLFGTYRMSDLLADYEKETFYYLLGRGGLEEANAYIDHLADASYGVLNTRAAERTKESADELAGSGFWGRRAADALSMLMSPVAAVGSAYYMAEVGLAKLRGENVEVNPNNVNLSANIYKKEARAKIQEEIARVYGKDTALGKFMSGLQEIISNRGDSMVNALTFGPLFKGVSPEMLNEFLSATPMAFAAATDAVADAKEKGASDTQLLGIFAATFLAEAGTEAVSIDNMRNAFGMGGGGFNGKTVREFLHNWLTKAGISEMFGESLNDFIENTADELIMGDQSEFQQNVQRYMTEEHMSREDAELAARRDQMMGILHTALISYLSPGMDIGSFAAGSLNYYKGKARDLQEAGVNASIFDVMRAEKERRNAPVEAKQTEVQNEQAETTEQAPVEETQEQTEVSSAEEAGAAVPVYEADTAVEVDPEQQKAEQIAADYQILDNAGKTDVASQTATIASVLQLDETDASSDMAKAAAAKLNEFVSTLKTRGKTITPVEWLKNLWLGASETKVSLETVKQAVTSAVLGGEQSAAYQEFQKAKFRKADFDAQVLRLAKAVEADNANLSVQDQIAKSIHEARIVEAEGQIIANGQQLGGDITKVAARAQQTADKTAKALAKAKENLETRQNELTAASDALNQANEDLRNEPTDANRKRVVGAISKYNSIAAVVQEYQQSLTKAEQDNTVAQENAEKAINGAMTEIRQQAERLVAEEDQRRAGIAAEQEQMQQQEAEQMAAVEAVSNEVNNITRNEADSYIEQFYPNATEEEKQTIRDTFNRIQSEVPVNPVTRDENGQMTPEAVQRRDKFIQQISKKFGINIAIEDTTRGGVVDRQNGYYDRRNNRIVLDQGATIDDAMFFVLGHELTHVAEQSQTYTALARSLARMKYGYDDAQLAADIRAKKALYDDRLVRMHEQDNTIDATPLTEEEAAQEIVADIMGDLLRGDENLINRLASEEPSTARKILNSIKSFIKKAVGMKGAWVSDAQRTVDMLEKALKEAQESKQTQQQEQIPDYTKEDKFGSPYIMFDSTPGKILQEELNRVGMKFYRYPGEAPGEMRLWGPMMGLTVSQSDISKAMVRARAKANGTQYSLTEAKPIVTDDEGNELAYELPGGTVGVDKIQYSLKSFDDEEQEEVRQALYNAKDENGNYKFTHDQVDKYMTDALGLASMIAADKTRLDFEANENQKFLKKNQDYYYTLDASTLCAKRLLYQGTFNQAQHLLPNEAFMPDDLIDLVNIMREMGYETPCGICYVESRRRWLDKYAQEWLDSYEGEYKPNIDDLTTSDGLETLRADGLKKGKDSPEYKAYEDFIAAMNAKGSANPKVVQLRTEYTGEIRDLSDSDIQKVKDIGGLRIQSFSDFEVPHLLDMVQAVYDMAARKLTSNAYTKVPNFAWVFGDTGIKINLSLIGKGTGLDENGNLVFDDIEGMNHEEAFKLRDRYSKNVGSILVGINDEHIIAAMGDPRIDFIIPFHQSGWSKGELSRISVLNNYSDYTATQNERVILGPKYTEEKGKGQKAIDNWIAKNGEKYPGYEVIDEGNGKYTIKYKNGYESESFSVHAERTGEKLSNFEPVGANKYWDFDKSGEWNANNYLKMCADAKRLPKFYQFLVDNGDGTFSLPQGDDKRSKSIREGYWKTLIDFKMYENDGYGRDGMEVKGSPQMEVTPNVNMNQAQRVLNEYGLRKDEEGNEYYKLGRIQPNGKYADMEDNNSLPTADPAARAFVDYIQLKREEQRKKAEQRLADKEAKEAAGIVVKPESKEARDKRITQEGEEIYNTYSGRVFGAYMGDATLGNAETQQEETAPQQRQMAVDSETGETVRYSLPEDAEYMAAVERGENEEAQRMVEQSAQEAGYAVHAYHGTPTGGFTVFNLDNQNSGRAFGDGIYYTDNENVAKEFTRAYGRDFERVGGNLNPTIYNGYLNLGENPLVIDLNQLREENGDKPSLIDYLMKQEVKNNGDDASAIVVRGIRDGSTEESTVYVLKDPTQIKSADTVTYDDEGNVIPLSERFNTANPDIRYSLPSENLLEQQIRQYLQRGGSLTPNNPIAGYRQWGNKGAQQSDVLAERAKNHVLNSPYIKDTNAKELARAIDWIGKNATETDPDGYAESLRKVTSKTFNYRTKDGQARTIAVLGMAAAQNDVNAQIALADAYNREGTDIAQALQARKIFRLMTPEGRIAVMRKMLNDTQDQINRKGSNIELAFSDWVYKAAANATDENDFAAVQQAAAKELAEQIPSNWKDKLRGIRMLSMLGNPRTHIRNIIGNALFVPAVGLKNKLGAVAEIVSGQKNRTKTLSLFLNKEARQFAREDVIKMKETLTGEAKYNEGNLVKREQKPFKGLLQAVIDFNGNMLEKEDWTFLRGHYIRALGGWMQANGYTAEQLNNNSDLLDQGRAYAIQEAQKATYRDFNKMAQTLNNVSRNGGVAGFIVDATLPFKKTPANILKRGLEYSPAGIMKSLTADLYHLKQWMDFENGKLNALPEKAISPTEFIDHLCSGLAGSAIMAMGFLLANSGIITCGLDDDDDELEKAKGNQKYAFKASILGKDITFTMDWAAPMSMPFFVGAAIQNQLSNGGEVDVNEVINAFGNITEPVFNLSMLDGVNTLFKTSQYDDTNTLTQIGAKVVSNYVTSYVPSVIGAIARTIDDKQRKNFVESGKGTGVMGTFRYAVEQAQNKIPGLNQQNIPVRDVWGNEQTSSLAERILENFILPGYVSEYKDDPILNEIGRVYDATQDLSLMPSDPPKSFSYKNDKIVLTDKQWDSYKEQRGQTAFNMLTELMQNPDYLNASAATQADMIKDVWNYADKMGRKAVIPDFDMVTSNVDAIAEEGKIDGYKNEMVKALQLGDVDAYETMVEALLEEDVKESDIRKKIQDTYINKYNDAYRRSDYEEMADIQEILDDSGFDFDTDAWEEAVDKKYGI